MFIIRTAFWLSLALLILPLGRESQSATAEASQASFNIGQATTLVVGAAHDISNICVRQPDVCEAGSAAAKTIAVKAKLVFERVMNMIVTEANATESKNTSSENILSYAPAPPQRPELSIVDISQLASQNTLRRDDLMPAYGGPFAQSTSTSTR